MNNGLRILAASITAVPATYGAVQLGLALPINTIDAALTAGMFSLVVISSLICWTARAYKMLSFGINIFVPASILTAALLIFKN